MIDDNEIFIPPSFKFWNRGDGFGEITLFQRIIATIHGDIQFSPEDYYTYDEELGAYIETTDEIEFEPVSCFPGTFQSENDILKSFNGQYIENIEHLISLVESFPIDLLPKKPKGSIFDVFSQSDKFLISRNFDFDVLLHGKDLNQNVIENFSNFSNFLLQFTKKYKEINIEFLSHSNLNDNVYFLYQINEKFYLHLVFTKENKFILGEINKSTKMNLLNELNCNEYNYQSVCDIILEKLNIVQDEVSFEISYNQLLDNIIPHKKTSFFNELFENHLEQYIEEIKNSSFFILNRNLKSNQKTQFTCKIKRESFNLICNYSNLFNVTNTDFIDVFISFYFYKKNMSFL